MDSRRLTKTWIVAVLACVCCMLWGSAIPVIKTGYRLLEVEASDTASQIVFAGIRFTLAGEKDTAFGSNGFKRCLCGLSGTDSGPILFLLYRCGQYFRCEERDSHRIGKFYCNFTGMFDFQEGEVDRKKTVGLYSWICRCGCDQSDG